MYAIYQKYLILKNRTKFNNFWKIDLLHENSNLEKTIIFKMRHFFYWFSNIVIYSRVFDIRGDDFSNTDSRITKINWDTIFFLSLEGENVSVIRRKLQICVSSMMMIEIQFAQCVSWSRIHYDLTPSSCVTRKPSSIRASCLVSLFFLTDKCWSYWCGG